jgi:hypothetical protein
VRRPRGDEVAQALARQHAAATDDQQRHAGVRGAHAVDGGEQLVLHADDAALDAGRVEVAHEHALAELGQAARHRHVARGERAAAEDQRLLVQPVAHAVRSDAFVVGADARAAAESDAVDVGHAEIGAHAAHVHCRAGRAREALLQHADVAGGAADVDHDGVRLLREEGRAAHRVGRTRGHGEDREACRARRAHQRAVVLRQEEGRGDAGLRHGAGERVHDRVAEVAERRVEDGGVLAFEQAHAADFRRQRDAHARQRGAQHVCGVAFLRVVDQREHPRDRDVPDLVGGEGLRRRLDLGGHHRRDLAAVELEAATDDVGVRAHGRRDVLGPAGERRQRLRGRQRETDHADPRERAPLDERVGEVGRAYHHGAQLGGAHARARDHLAQHGQHARHHVGRCGRLHGVHDLVAVHQDGIRVGAADVDSYPIHEVVLAVQKRYLAPTPNWRPSASEPMA